MIISRIRSKNYGPFKGEQSVELGEGVFSILCEYDRDPRRSNRGGKSSFMEMIKYAIFGLVRDGLSEIELIYRDESEMEVELTFLDSDGTEFAITRGRTSKNDGMLKLSGAEGSSIADTQRLIEEKLGITGPDFLLSYFFAQEEMASFFKSKSSERKSCVIRWLEKEYWADWEKKVREDLKVIQKKFDDNLAIINSMTDTEGERIKSEIQISEGKNKLLELEAELVKIENKIDEIRKEIGVKFDISSLLKEKSAHEEALKSERDHFNTISLQIQKLLEELKNLGQNKELALSKKRESHESAIRALKTRHATIVQLIERMSSEIGVLNKVLLDYQENIRKASELETSLGEIPPNVVEFHDKAVDGLNLIRSEILSINKSLSSSDSFTGVCPYTKQQCAQGDDIEQYKRDLRDRLEAEKAKEGGCLQVIKSLKEKVDARTKLLVDLKYIKLNVDKVSLPDIQAKISGLENGIKIQNQELTVLGSEISAKEEEGENIEGDFNKEYELKVSEINSAHADLELERGKIQFNINQKIEILAGIAKQIEQKNNDQELVRLNGEMSSWLLTKKNNDTLIDEVKGIILTNENNLKIFVERMQAKSKLQAENDHIILDINDLTFIAYMFSPKGIPSIQVENSLQQVEDETNLILNKMGTGIQIEFQSQKETKTWEDNCLACGEVFQKGERKHVCKKCGIPREKKKKDDLHIWIITGGQRQLFEQDSGGGKTLIAFSFRMAIARLLQRGLNTRINSIFLDEILAALDEVNVEEIVRVILNSLRSQFGFEQIFIISHKMDVQESFENFIRVRRYDAEDRSTYERG